MIFWNSWFIKNFKTPVVFPPGADFSYIFLAGKNNLSENKSGKRGNMKNPFGNQLIPEPPGSYEKLQERIYKRVSAEVSHKIEPMLQISYTNALSTESVVLTRSERDRLFSQIVKMVMDDILKK